MSERERVFAQSDPKKSLPCRAEVRLVAAGGTATHPTSSCRQLMAPSRECDRLMVDQFHE